MQTTTSLVFTGNAAALEKEDHGIDLMFRMNKLL